MIFNFSPSRSRRGVTTSAEVRPVNPEAAQTSGMYDVLGDKAGDTYDRIDENPSTTLELGDIDGEHKSEEQEYMNVTINNY